MLEGTLTREREGFALQDDCSLPRLARSAVACNPQDWTAWRTGKGAWTKIAGSLSLAPPSGKPRQGPQWPQQQQKARAMQHATEAQEKERGQRMGVAGTTAAEAHGGAAAVAGAGAAAVAGAWE